MQDRQQSRQRVFGRQLGDTREQGCKWRGAELFDAGLIHAGVKIVAYFLLIVGAARGVARKTVEYPP
jgi:uncharacterized protein YbjT (DUF2867 family)